MEEKSTWADQIVVDEVRLVTPKTEKDKGVAYANVTVFGRIQVYGYRVVKVSGKGGDSLKVYAPTRWTAAGQSFPIVKLESSLADAVDEAILAVYHVKAKEAPETPERSTGTAPRFR